MSSAWWTSATRKTRFFTPRSRSCRRIASRSTAKPGWLLVRRRNRPVLEERAPPGRHARLGGPREVVPHLVVVPDRVDRRRAKELLHRGILALVAMARAELRERGRDEAGARHDARLVALHVRVDRVADEEEEVGPGARHRPEDAVAAVHLPAEAPAAEVAAPDEPHPGVLVVSGRRHELALRRLAGPLRLPYVARGGLEPPQHALGGEVSPARDPEDTLGAIARGRPESHHHLALDAEPCPHDGRRRGDVADRDEERGRGAASGSGRQGDEDEQDKHDGVRARASPAQSDRKSTRLNSSH